ncbi:hypothetical protein R70199_07411 [Paraburkholderia domus]|jgi:hypothetical protein|nr:hypothetical protein R70199_07411 [Paraburkholderia domus]
MWPVKWSEGLWLGVDASETRGLRAIYASARCQGARKLPKT